MDHSLLNCHIPQYFLYIKLRVGYIVCRTSGLHIYIIERSAESITAVANDIHQVLGW